MHIYILFTQSQILSVIIYAIYQSYISLFSRAIDKYFVSENECKISRKETS